MKKLLVVLAVLFIGILIAGCTSQPAAPVTTPVPTAVPTAVPTPVVTMAPVEKTIVETAVADGRFTTLVAALKAAKLDGTLSGAGPFTVFAPTDDAFKKLPNGTVLTLLKDPEGQLKQILLYHVVSGSVMSGDAMKLTSAKTVQGDTIAISVKNDSLMVNGAKVIIKDIKCSNGVIHVIDAVILPPEKKPTVTATPTPVPTYTITFTQDLTIMPSSTAYVKVGTKVIWKNDDPFKPHTIIANDIETITRFGSQEAIAIPYGGSIEVVFDKAGSYDYTTGPFQPAEQSKIIVTA